MPRQYLFTAALLAATVALAGCGGGSGGSVNSVASLPGPIAQIEPSPTTQNTRTPLPPTPFTIPAGTGLCDGANLVLALTVNSSTVTVDTSADLSAGGSRVRCPCDWNRSGAVTVQDIFDYLSAYFGGTGDFNGTAGTTVQDIFDFLACYFSPPRPPC